MPKNMKWYAVEERAPKDGEVIAFIGSDRFHGINELRSGTVEYEVDILDVDGRSTGHSFWFDEKRPVKDQLVEMVASLEPGESLRVNYFCDGTDRETALDELQEYGWFDTEFYGFTDISWEG